MKFATTWWGPLFILILVSRLGLQYGQRWEFGRYGMPRSLLRSDGVALSYADGTPVDPINAWLIRAQREEEFILVLLLIIMVAFGAAVWIVWDTARKRRRIREILNPNQTDLAKRSSQHVAKLDQE